MAGNPFTNHPKEVGESYGAHFANAIRLRAADDRRRHRRLVHAVFPFLFVKTGSRTMDKLHTNDPAAPTRPIGSATRSSDRSEAQADPRPRRCRGRGGGHRPRGGAGSTWVRGRGVRSSRTGRRRASPGRPDRHGGDQAAAGGTPALAQIAARHAEIGRGAWRERPSKARADADSARRAELRGRPGPRRREQATNEQTATKLGMRNPCRSAPASRARDRGRGSHCCGAATA